VTVTVKFFASLRDVTGLEEMQHEFDGVNLADLIESLKKALTREAFIEITAKNVKVAVNQELIDGSAAVSDGDEVAFLPPVTGG
tara:strand:+ start:611 stop:862 length:252 start_codon:yes stop_codon:yes gene_type:complete